MKTSQRQYRVPERVESCWQTPPEGGHTIIPGQWVMIKSFRNKPLEPKWYGPHQVMLITAAAVLCQGRKAGLMCHTVKLFPPYRDRIGHTTSEEPREEPNATGFGGQPCGEDPHRPSPSTSPSLPHCSLGVAGIEK